MSMSLTFPPPLIPGSANLQTLEVSSAKIGEIDATGEIQSKVINILGPSGTTNTKITSQATSSDVLFNLPTGPGVEGQFLTSDGSGNLDWGIPTVLQFSDNVKTAELPDGSNISLNPAPVAINGYTLVNGDLVLLMAQTNAIENGVYKLNGTVLERPTTGLYSTGSNVVETVTFVIDGTSKNNSFIQSVIPATVGTDPLTYVLFSAAPEAKGPQYAIQYSDPLGVLNGSGDFTWNGSKLDITGEMDITGDITTSGGDLTVSGGNIRCQGGDITAISGGIVANNNIEAGGDLLTGNAGNPTTIKTGASAAQSVTLPDNAGNVINQVLSVSTSGVDTLTEWKDVSTLVTPAGANTQVQFNNGGVFGASANLTWDGSVFDAVGTIKSTGSLNTTTGDIIFGDTSGSHLNLKSGSGGAEQNITLPNMMAQGPGAFLMLSTPGFDMTGGAVPFEGETVWIDAPIYDGAFPVTSSITRTVPYFDVIDWPDPTGVDPTATRGIATVKNNSGISIPVDGQLVASTSISAGSLTDGVATLNSGSLTGSVNITASGAITLGATSTVGFYGTVPVAQQAAVAVIPPAVAAPSKAEYDALAAAFNDLVSKMKAYGMLA